MVKPYATGLVTRNGEVYLAAMAYGGQRKSKSCYQEDLGDMQNPGRKKVLHKSFHLSGGPPDGSDTPP